MTKRLSTFLLALVTTYCSAQTTQYLGSPTTTVENRGKLVSDSALRGPLDTLASAPNGSHATKNGVPYYKSAGVWFPVVTGVSDVGRFPAFRQLYPGQGIAASGTTLTNFPIFAVDSSYLPYTTTNYFTSGTKFGGVLWNSGGGDSAQFTAPFGIAYGSSFMESHSNPRSFHGRLHPNGATAYTWNYPDSIGNFTWYMRQLTNYRWYNQGIGGQTSYQARARWSRDVLGQIISSTLDGRAAQTISRKPYIVIFDGAGNDPYTAGNTPQGTIDNLIYMAASCQENNIRFIVCNSPAGPGTNVVAKAYLETVNKFLESGVLEKYGTVVYDLQKYWSDSRYGIRNGIVGNPNYVNTNDGIHFTNTVGNTTAGYDSLAVDMFNTCKIPKLTKVIISSGLALNTPITDFNYPNAMTIDAQGYTLTNIVDSITITSPLGNGNGLNYESGDSVWIKFTGLAHVVGNSTTYGIGHIDWVLENIPLYGGNAYTNRTLGSNGATGTVLRSLTEVGIKPENNIVASPSLWVSGNDGTGYSFYHLPTGSGSNTIFNGGTNTARIANAKVSVYASGGFGLGTDGSISATGTNNQIANFQIRVNATPGATGTGISTNNTGTSTVAYYTTTATAVDAEYHGYYTGAGNTRGFGGTPSSTSNNWVLDMGFGNTGATGQIGNVINIKPVYNNTVACATCTVRGIYYNPTVTALGSMAHIALETTTGVVKLGTTSGNTLIGTSTDNGTDKLQVNGATQTLGIKPKTSTQSGTTLTLDGTATTWVFTGSSAATWTLPAISGNTDLTYFIKNRGSATITLTRAGSDNLYTTSSVTSLVINPGESYTIANDGAFWDVL